MSPEPYPESLSRTRRRAAGAFYTPASLVDTVVDEALGPALDAAVWAGAAPVLRVLDPACGDGRFLVACGERIAERAALRGIDRDVAFRAAVERCLVGVERDPEAATVARTALGPGADVRVAEALLEGAAAEHAWDVVVGNPPWVRSIGLKTSDEPLWRRLRGAFAATSYKEWDLSAAFVEKSLAWLAPGGRAGLVTPSRWLTAAFAAPLRERLATARAVARVVDFGGEQLFEGATTYTALVFLEERGVDVVAVAGGSLPAARLGSGPWILHAGARADALDALAALGPPLGQVARIAKGAGTNADPVFLLERRGGTLWSPALGEAVVVEDELLVPCLRGRDIGRYRATVCRQALLPYDGPRLLPFAHIERRFPAAAAYLERCRPLLEARERGRFRGERFHSWGRAQNLVFHRDPAPKIVFPDATAAGRAAVDEQGTLVIDTAYAVRPTRHDVPIGLLLAVLNHALVATWLRARGVPLRGGYFRMKTDYLASLPVPAPSSPAARRAAQAALAGDADGADAALAELLP